MRGHASLSTTCILDVVVFGGSGMVVFCSCQLVTVGKKDTLLKCEFHKKTIIPSALETPMIDIETEAILATVT